nr:tRNA lysidine(34) synthetase TilS [Corynebacterium gerontici]
MAVGLSGGPDSLALVAALVAEGVQVRALCVDHQLDANSAEVAYKAASIARGFGAEAEVLHVRVKSSKGMEADAREVRYRALTQAVGEGVLAVGHTRDDQAETLLLSALRGKAAGMPRWRDMGAVQLWRPLLHVGRVDTLGACEELGLEPWMDPLNHAEASRRVALREYILPQLSQLIGGDAVTALAGAAEELVRDEQALEWWAGDVEKLEHAPSAVRRRAIAKMLQQAGIELKKAHLDAGEALVCDWHGQGAVKLGKGLELVRKDGTLWVERAER